MFVMSLLRICDKRPPAVHTSLQHIILRFSVSVRGGSALTSITNTLDRTRHITALLTLAWQANTLPSIQISPWKSVLSAWLQWTAPLMKCCYWARRWRAGGTRRSWWRPRYCRTRARRSDAPGPPGSVGRGWSPSPPSRCTVGGNGDVRNLFFKVLEGVICSRVWFLYFWL